MKNLLSGCWALLFVVAILWPNLKVTAQSESTYHHCFFEPGSISLGAAVPYFLEGNHAGVNARAYYNINHALCFGPEYTFASTSHGQIQDIDVVAHYIFETPFAGIYPVAGANFTQETSDGHTQDAFGFLWGAGLHRNFKNITLFAEYTRVESTLGEHFITAGVLFRLNLKTNKD